MSKCAWGGTLFAQVTFTSTAGRILRIAVGTFLIVLGLIQVEAIPVSFHVVADAAKSLLRSQARLRREAPVLGYALLGFGYLLAGFG